MPRLRQGIWTRGPHIRRQAARAKRLLGSAPTCRRWCTPRVSDFRSIDIAWLRRKCACAVGYSGRITWSRRGEKAGSLGYRVELHGLRLQYRTTPRGGLPQDINDLIPIVTTRMHYGGCRHWFACPSCGRRCRQLYGGSHFRCRLCRGAKYDSQYESEPLRISAIRWRIRGRLEERGGQGWPFGLDDGFPPKPPRMHWKTYRRLEALDERLAGRWGLSVSGWLERRNPVRP